MRLLYGKQDFRDGVRGQESCWLLTNGLGGFSSQNLIGGASRNDHAVLMACTVPPNQRWNLIHRLEEVLTVQGRNVHLSSQRFAGAPEEEGWKHLSCVEVDGLPRWRYQTQGVQVEKMLALDWEQNTLVVRYEVENESGSACALTITPWLQFVPKGQDLDPGQPFVFRDHAVESAGLRMRLFTNGRVEPLALRFQTLQYDYDVCDGRRAQGLTAANHRIRFTMSDGGRRKLEIVYSLEENVPSASSILRGAQRRMRRLEKQCGLHHPAARQLAVSADAFIVQRQSTGAKTILAGYPFFEDWGRDTMIALPGCTLATGRFEDARSILETFLEHERGGLMPNLFPEGGK